MQANRPEWFLWKKRYFYHWSQRWKMLGLVIDWVIALYFIVPTLVIGTVMYFQGIQSPPTWWNDGVATLVLVLLMVYPILQRVSPLFSLGDEGILIASPLSPRKLLLYRWIEDIVMRFCTLIVLWGLLLPYLKLIGYSLIQVGMLAFFSYILQLFIVQNHWLWTGHNRWFHKIGWFIHMLALVSYWIINIKLIQNHSFLLVFLLLLITLILWVLLLLRNYNHKWQWSMLIQESVGNHLGMIDFVLGGESTKKQLKSKKKRPAFLLRGGLGLPFRPENALLLWYIKAFLRTRDLMLVYIQALFYILAAVFIIPILWVSVIVLVVGLFMLGNVLLSHVRNNENPWVEIYPFTYEHRKKGYVRGASILNAFVGILGSVLITIQIGQWYYFFPIATIMSMVARMSCEAASMSAKKSRQRM